MPTFLALTGSLGCLEGFGPLANIGCPTDPTLPLTTFETTLSVTIGILTVCAGLWFMLQVFISAFKWLASGGDKQAIETARKGLTNAVIGLFLVVFAYAFTSLIGLVFGLRILNPADTIKNIVAPQSDSMPDRRR